MATKEWHRQYFLAHKDEINSNRRARDKRIRDKLNAVERNYIATPRGKIWNRNKKLRAKYGIDHDQYLLMEAAQDKLCAICGNPSDSEFLEVDHDHLTKKLRELLCSLCNRMIGLAKESPETLRKAALYLEKHRESSV